MVWMHTDSRSSRFTATGPSGEHVMSYERLDPTHIIDTVDKLADRIDRRFPDAGLGRVCGELLMIARAAQERAEEIKEPNIPLRIGSATLVLTLLAGLIYSLAAVKWPSGEIELTEYVGALEAAINDVVLLGAAVFFTMTIETRIKRSRALAAIHELRSMAHIIDMHQLTKDPDRAERPAIELEDGSKSTDHLTAQELIHYLDYCSEMLSLIGKIAALYVQRFDDSVALAAVNEVESLTTGLSRKIWQKIMILHSVRSAQTSGASSSKAPWTET